MEDGGHNVRHFSIIAVSKQFVFADINNLYSSSAK
jgi:hypothetical protein